MEEIIKELYFLGGSILCGVFLPAAYDILRVFRHIVKHASIIVAIEDVLFWTAAGVVFFIMVLERNDGRLRGFAFLGLGIGFFLYRMLLYRPIMGIVNYFRRKIERKREREKEKRRKELEEKERKRAEREAKKEEEREKKRKKRERKKEDTKKKEKGGVRSES